MLSDILVDDDRFRQILDEEIAKGEIDSFPAYEKETDASRKKAKDVERKRREDFDKEQDQEEEAGESTAPKKNGKSKAKGKKKSGGDMADLAALIQQRQKSRAGNFFDQLEAKYAAPSRGGKRSTPMDEPPEELFEANRAKKLKRTGRAQKARVVDEDEDMDLGEEDIGDSEDDEVEARRKPKAKPKAKGRGRTKA